MFLFFFHFRLTGPVLSVEPMPLRCSGTLSDLWFVSTPNTHNPQLPLTPFWMHQSVNIFPFTLDLHSHILPRNWDQCSLTLHSLSPRTLNSHCHLGSAFRVVETFYWLVLTLLLDFIGLLLRTLMPLILCLLLMVTPLWEWPLKHTYDVKCRWTLFVIMSRSKLMQHVESTWWTEKSRVLLINAEGELAVQRLQQFHCYCSGYN